MANACTDYPFDHGHDGKPMGVATNELNQLKYACRQLNIETKGIAMTMNEIVFLRGVPNFNQFTNDCPPAILDHISAIEIHQEQPYEDDKICDAADRTELVEFCKQHPATAVRLRHSWLDPDGDDFFGRVVEFAVNFRKDTTLIKRVTTDPQREHSLLQIALQIWSKNSSLSSVDDIQGYPANLRAFPPFLVLDEDTFRAYHEDFPYLQSMPNNLDGAVALAKEIFDQGI
jgi:hypothetical protein